MSAYAIAWIVVISILLVLWYAVHQFVDAIPQESAKEQEEKERAP